MKKYLTFIIFTVLIISSCSDSKDLNKDVDNWKEIITQEHNWDIKGQLKAVGWSATDEVQWSETTGESDFNNN